MTGSQALLADYVQNGSDQAFRELVGAYVNFVFSTALRVVGGDRHLAEDVVQTVFTDLARKAPLLPVDVKLGGWLHRHTCFVGRKALRGEHRRRMREQRALEMQVINDYSTENLGHVAAILDEAINSLGAADRTAIALRFFEQLDFRAVGKALGSSEDAARMRVARAVEKLGTLLRRRGIALSFAGLGYILATKTVSAAAPPGLAAATCKVALAQGAHQMGLAALFKEICVTKLNVALISAAAVIAIATVFIPSPPTVVEAEPELDGVEFAAEPALENAAAEPMLIGTVADSPPSPAEVVTEPVSQPEPTAATAAPNGIVRTSTAAPLVQTKPARPLAPPVNPPAPAVIQPVVQNRPIPAPRPELSLGTSPRWQRGWEGNRSQVLFFPAPSYQPRTTSAIAPVSERAHPTAVQNPPSLPIAPRRQWSPVIRPAPNSASGTVDNKTPKTGQRR